MGGAAEGWAQLLAKGLNLATEDTYRTSRSQQRQVGGDFDEYLTFAVYDEEYAVSILRVREIIRARLATAIPRVPPFLLGIISVRGTIIPVIDLRLRLRLPVRELTKRARIVVVDRGGEPFGLLVDRVDDVVRMRRGALEPAPAVIGGVEADFIAGIGRQQGRMVIVLALKSVLAIEDEIRRVAAAARSGR